MSVHIINCIIFILLIFIHYIFGYNIKIPSMEKDKRIELTTNLIDGCFPDVRASILITDSTDDKIYNDFYKSMTGSVTLLDKSGNYSIPMNQKTPVPCVIMTLTSPTKVTEVLFNEIWRNFNQFFIILDGGDISNGCTNAQSFLMEAWKNDILDVIFICWDHQKKISKLYSFNPFTDFAPKSWKKISVVPAINNHSWTLFRKNYNTNAATCKNLFFDKTDNLGGYIIKVGVFNMEPYNFCENINGTKFCEGYDYDIIKLVVQELNGTLIIADKIAEVVGNFFKERFGGVLWQISTKQTDLAMNSLFIRETFNKAVFTYPFQEGGISVMTQYREFEEIGGQVFTFLPLGIAILFFVTSILIFILLRYIFKDPYSKNLIDILRVYLNLSLPSSTVTNPGKVLFGFTLVTFMISNIIIQSYMETVLISKNVAKNVENIQDLIEMKYRGLANGFIHGILNASGFEIENKTFENFNCSKIIKNYKENVAFSNDERFLRTLTADACHMPRKPLVSGIYQSYYTRRNWPLHPKINKKLQLLFEGGFTDFQMKQILKKYPLPKRKEPDQYQDISIRHMEYIYYISIAFIIVSLIVFVIELCFPRLFCNPIQLFQFVN